MALTRSNINQTTVAVRPAAGSNIWQNFDFLLLGSTALLVFIGILFIRSATLDAVDTDLISRVPSQITYAIVGLFVVIGLAAFDYRLLGALQPYIYFLLLFSLGLVATAGLVGDAGAQRWLDVGIPIQPSEIGKMLLIIALGQHLTNQYEKLDRFSTLLVSIIYVAIPAAFIFLQPNLGNVIAFSVIWFTMVWGAGVRFMHLFIIFLAVLLALPLVWSAMQPYQQERIETFLNPDAEENRDAQFNRDQALIAIGSGGLTGTGYTSGSQTQGRFLRVRHTDFIFSVIAEETGFLGVTVVLTLMGTVIWRITRIAQIARDPLGSLICYGVAGIITFQTIVSIGMNLSILPVTGLTLPFLSSGGSSLLTLLFGIGLVESVAIRNRYTDLVG